MWCGIIKGTLRNGLSVHQREYGRCHSRDFILVVHDGLGLQMCEGSDFNMTIRFVTSYIDICGFLGITQ